MPPRDSENRPFATAPHSAVSSKRPTACKVPASDYFVTYLTFGALAHAHNAPSGMICINLAKAYLELSSG